MNWRLSLAHWQYAAFPKRRSTTRSLIKQAIHRLGFAFGFRAQRWRRSGLLLLRAMLQKD
ncbi:hypothetical protein L227DRAFT_580141 [Lentinus tigrinus ALCF2SS1-6]|uniref:Uncharacterized protein n=1 Tax=Lentinus tigrinus ALCF2SS1-6 TaxID=1328759 RepID=A0A5C2RTW3_9APHY|nr:hypothetical protein L227DRAFT_580141 [Lentinus tigrinus ALCF2SS1-6]